VALSHLQDGNDFSPQKEKTRPRERQRNLILRNTCVIDPKGEPGGGVRPKYLKNNNWRAWTAMAITRGQNQRSHSLNDPKKSSQGKINPSRGETTTFQGSPIGPLTTTVTHRPHDSPAREGFFWGQRGVRTSFALARDAKTPVSPDNKKKGKNSTRRDAYDFLEKE